MQVPAEARIFDVTMRLSPELPVLPGDPEIVVEPATRIAAGDIASLSRMSLSSHAGTHVDAPWHFFDDGAKLDDIPPDRWIGPCLVLAIPDRARRIEPEHLEAANIAPGTERLIFRTSNSSLWRRRQLVFDQGYVALAPDAARWVVEHRIRLVGIDYLSIEPFDDATFQTHRTLLGNDVLIIETLDLSAVDPGPYTLVCLPLKLAAGDGAPARVLLIRQP